MANSMMPAPEAQFERGTQTGCGTQTMTMAGPANQPLLGCSSTISTPPYTPLLLASSLGHGLPKAGTVPKTHTHTANTSTE